MRIKKVRDSFKTAFVASNKQMQRQINRLYVEITANLNCFMNQLHHSIEGHKIRQKTISVMAPFLAVMLFTCYIFVTAPYGLTEDGKKIEQPYVIKAGTIELAVVENSTVAEQVMAQFQKAYLSDGAEIVSFETEPFLNIAKKDLGRASGKVTVVNQVEAMNALVKSCDGLNPLMTATLTEQLVQNKEIAYTSAQEKASDLTVGTTKVKTAGVNGTIANTMSITKVNGQIVASTLLQETIVTNPVNEVILVGTKPVRTYTYAPKASISTASSAVAASAGISGSSGDAIVAYAKLFLGNPYVYGGTSLTNGTDCSGFTMGVYRNFGVYLPHSSYSQRSVGTAVSYGEARPGDIICYSGHVAMYIGGGKIIHASTTSTGIILGNATYRPIITVRRIL